MIDPNAKPAADATGRDRGEDAREDRYARSALESECRKVASAPEGERNNTLNTAALKMGHYVGGGLIDERTAKDELTAAGIASGLPAAEVAATVNSGLRAGMKEPKSAPPPRDERGPARGETSGSTADDGAGQDNGGSSAGKGAQQAVRQKGLQLVCMADVEPEDVRWLWPERIAIGCLSVLAGPASIGKGLVTMDIAARVTTGGAWPDGAAGEAPADVLFISGEDDPKRVIRPRLSAAGADVRRVHAGNTVLRLGPGGKPYTDGFTLADVPDLEASLRAHPECRLVVIDPIGDFVGARTQTDKDNQVRAVMQPIAALAEKYDVAILIVAHYRKAEAIGADDRIMGSRAFTALARSVWHVMLDEQNDRRLLLAGKSNLVAPAPGLAFSPALIDVPGVNKPHPAARWQQEAIPQTADEWLASLRGENKPGPKPEQATKAEEFLTGFLKGRGPVPAKEVVEAAKAAGVSEPTLNRAKKKLGVAGWRQWKGTDAPWAWWWPEDQSDIIESFIRHAEAKRARRRAEVVSPN